MNCSKCKAPGICICEPEPDKALSEPPAVLAGWQPIETAPKDGTHILAILHRAAGEDMDGIRWPAFREVREIFYRPYRAMGMQFFWHAGDPFDEPSGMACEHMGEDVPTHWMPLPPLPVGKRKP